jgi:hypothetical protein
MATFATDPVRSQDGPEQAVKMKIEFPPTAWSADAIIEEALCIPEELFEPWHWIGGWSEYRHKWPLK